MKKLLLALVSFVLVVVVAALIIPFLIPMETYKKEIIARVKEATGRELVIAGAMKVTLFPVAGVRLEKVSFSNPDGYSKKQMFEAVGVTLEVAALPLLHKEVVVNRFVFEQPVIDLEVAKDGKPNWEVNMLSLAVSYESPQAMLVSSAMAAEPKAKDFLSNIRLADVQIHKGQLSYRDQRSGVNEKVGDLDLKLSLANIDSPLKAIALLTWKKELVRIETVLTTPRQLLQGDETALQAAVKSGVLAVQFGGKARIDGSLNGDLMLEAASLSQLAGWVGDSLPSKGRTPLQFATKGMLACTSQQCGLTNAAITLDALKLNGDVVVLFGGALPTVKAKLVADSLDLTPYLPKPEGKQASLWISDAIAAPAGGWDDTPLDLKGLRAVNAELDVTVGSLLVQKLKLGKTLLHTTLRGGRLEADIPNTQLYGGEGNARVVLDASGSVPMIEQRMSVKNVEAQALLADAADFMRLSGKMEQNLDVRATGASQKQMVGTLSGNGSVRFTDGAIHGINVAAMMRNVQGAFTGVGGGEQKTDFAELSGTFQIVQGIVNNKDLAMKAPLLRVRGEGAVDLLQRQIKYRITPEVVPSLEGQGGADKSGLSIPVLIEGPLDSPGFRPDLAAAAQDALKNPEKIKETLKDVKEQLKQLKKGGGGVQVDHIKGLLQGFSGR